MGGNDLFAVILMAVVLVGVGMFVSAPLLRSKPEDIFHDDYEESPMHHLLSRKDSIYAAMKDLEFDYSTGKLSEDDYQSLRNKFSAEAAGVLKEIDSTEKGTTKTKIAKDVCEACGFKVKKDDQFCESCGAKVA